MNWRYRHSVLVLCTLAFAATMVARLVISPVIPRISAEFEVTNSLVGLALSAMWVAYAVSQFPSGILGDRFGERRIILTAVGLTALSSLLLAVSPSFGVFFVFTIVLGSGAGLHYSVATTFLARHYDDIGRAIGFHIAGAPIAGLLAPILAAIVAARYGWRAALLLGTVVAVPVFVLFAWRIRPTEPRRPEQNMRDRFRVGPVVELLTRPEITFTTVLSMLGAFSWQATASWLPTFLEVHHGLSTAAAGAFFSAYFVIHGATQPVMGWLSDRLSRDAAAGVTMVSGIAGYTAIVLADGLLAIGASILFVGVAMSWGAPLQSRFIDKLSAAEQNAGFGLVRTVYMVLGASGSVVVGLLSELFGWAIAFGAIGGILTISLVALTANRLFDLRL
ncbi:MAG: MFS transporter [Halobacteriota archaeon]